MNFWANLLDWMLVCCEVLSIGCHVCKLLSWSKKSSWLWKRRQKVTIKMKLLSLNKIKTVFGKIKKIAYLSFSVPKIEARYSAMFIKCFCASESKQNFVLEWVKTHCSFYHGYFNREFLTRSVYRVMIIIYYQINIF